MKGFIFNIQRFSTGDGPGIRTTVFLKGCNLNCKWCHNPESISGDIEIQYFPQKCVGCGKCIEVCKTKAHYINENNEKIFDRSKCNKCGLCVKECLYDALVFTAKYIESEEVVNTIEKDIAYYKNSNGGITISGGEPLLQKEFVREIFQNTKELGIHNALDTAFNVDWETIEYVLPWTDLILLDIKVMDSQVHKKFTGVSNLEILENARKLSKEKVDIIVRIPVVTGVNDNEDNMTKVAEVLSDFKNLLHVELVPYHDMGVYKHTSLGREDEQSIFEIPTSETMNSLAKHFKGLKVIIID